MAYIHRCQNNIQIKKLWIQLSYILLMFQRYLNSYDIEIEATIYLYDDEKKYHIDRWEKIWVGDKVFYLWAILKEYSEGDYPVYDHFVERR